jgi:hypothetical protein
MPMKTTSDICIQVGVPMRLNKAAPWFSTTI